MLMFLEKARKEYLRFIRKQYHRYYDKIHNEEFLCDVYQSGGNAEKKVLLSYLTRAYEDPGDLKHTSWLECKTAGDIFHSLGYQVDVVDYTASCSSVDFSRYDVVYGGGQGLTLALDLSDIKTVLYSAGCSSNFAHPATLKSLRRFEALSGTRPWVSARIPQDGLRHYYFADAIIVLGNEWVADTHRFLGGCPSVTRLDGFFHDVMDIDLDSKFESCDCKTFIWFGSVGAVHKGLDLVLEVFKRRKDLKLYICGVDERERDFWRFYEDELGNKVSNIINLGFVDLDGEQFRQLMHECIAVVSPSASEGGAVAMLNLMANGGLIPIISKASGLDVDHYGFVFNDLDVDSIEFQLEKLLKMPIDAISDLSRKVKSEARDRYCYANYRSRLSTLIQEIVM